MGAGRRERNLSRRVQHRERLQTPGELRCPAGIDKAELRTHLAPQGSAAGKPTLCHNVLQARSGLGRTQGLQDLALAPHGLPPRWSVTAASTFCARTPVSIRRPVSRTWTLPSGTS